ncbi:serine hydrolase domain-containing protein [Deinococcus cellulosilyticus]|uniref:Beta-lactamase n=1 Tax=Deinococcus cellulosilyticus (strain DSM 18568 / NBRC 106333 / KACC 11606 / 5516J-15) TaxID=1223518 RepID=A0A511MUZ5_DEIC1|nr:serine hydrolase domain-containing protein [Deinococcus cellulosilyticus]GEM44414.1 hypothetical protein DC3_00490 [Deinococcus cellulosilyticus NBRC 106333 = KACC 11606]
MQKLLTLLLPLSLGSALAAPDYAAVVGAHQNARHFMGDVVIREKGKVIFQQSAGLANVEFEVPNSAETVFEIGSVSKSFTAVAILKLQEQGKLKVTDPLSKFLAGFAYGDQVTLHHLLTHTSGVPSFTSFPGFIETQKQNISQEKIVEMFREKPLEFAPGDHFSYSNSGYTLLGRVIEKASGMPYQQYITEHVLAPLGFKKIAFHSRLDLVKNRASGYVLDGASFRLPEAHNVEIAGPAGGLFATASELSQWLPSLFEGKLLTPESIKAFSAPHVKIGNEPGFSSYGYGVGTGDMFGHQAVSHGGNINGFNAVTVYFPEEKISMTVTSNVEGISSTELVMDLIKTRFDVPVKLPTPRTLVSVPETVLKGYEGSYKAVEAPLSLRFYVHAGMMMLEIPGQGIFQLLPEAEDRFYLSALDSELTFKKTPEGMTLEVLAGGQILHASRE